MEIIPVIDLLHGKVVRAERGERNRYRPIRSQLCDSCELSDIMCALAGLYPFTSLYIADLNAIQGMGNHAAQIAGLRHQFPHIELWVDAGVSEADGWSFPNESNIRCVIGSEMLNSIEQYTALSTQVSAAEIALSLDFDRDGFRGPGELLRPEYWPSALICMTLAKVGSYEGPDFEKIAKLVATDRQRKVYAAGGIRHFEDLKRLQDIGAAGALIASALHDGKIDAAQLAELRA